MLPKDATHKCSRSGLYYKEAGESVYVWSRAGRWVTSIGGPLEGHPSIQPIEER